MADWEVLREMASAGESVEYSAAFSGRDFIAGVDRQKLKWWMGLLVGIAVSSAIEISRCCFAEGCLSLTILFI